MRRDDKGTKARRGRGWLVPAGLLTLSFVPVLAGAIRLTELTSGAEITSDNARFFAFPAPVTVHIVSVTLYTVLGAFQFAPRFRRRRPGWHRASGRVLVGAGLLAALSGLWLTLFSELPPGDAGLLGVFRLVFGSAMLASIVLGFAAIRRRDVRRHRAWMIRGYAIGIGAGTQAFTQGLWIAFAGTPDAFTRALLLGAAWVINLAVAEWIIRRRRGGPGGPGGWSALDTIGLGGRSALDAAGLGGFGRRSALDAVGLVRPHGDLDAVAHPQLGHQARDMALDRTQ